MVIFGDFLAQWPTRKAVQRARRSALERFCHASHVRYADIIDQRIRAIKSATLLTLAAGLMASHALLVQALVTQLRVTLLEPCDHAIAPRAQRHPDFP